MQNATVKFTQLQVQMLQEYYTHGVAYVEEQMANGVEYLDAQEDWCVSHDYAHEELQEALDMYNA